MKNQLVVAGLALVLAVSVVGCGTTKQLGPAAVQVAVQAGAAIGMNKEPAAIPYVEAATPVICSAAGSGVFDPAQVVSALENSPANFLKTPTGVIVINGALALYQAVYNSYGTNIQASVVEPYLLAVCNGLTGALSTLPTPTPAATAKAAVIASTKVKALPSGKWAFVK